MNEKLTFPLFLIFKKVLTVILFLSFIFSDDSWKVYDESDLAYIHITIDPEDLEWMYDNVESDSMHVATFQFQNSRLLLLLQKAGCIFLKDISFL